jgi:hypothetical protein
MTQHTQSKKIPHHAGWGTHVAVAEDPAKAKPAARRGY